MTMFVLQKRLTKLLCSYSSIHLAGECRYSSARNDYNTYIDSKYMQKLLNKRGGKTRKKWYQSHIADPMELLSLKEPKNKHGETRTESTRGKQLGHVLYDKIAQIINTGELSEEILSKQVFITSVRMLPNFQGVHVYWDNNRSDAAEVDSLLQANAAKLRGILISYHVLGRIPVITFVKDKQYTNLSRLNQLFEVADYGPDYVPSCQNNNLRNQLFSKSGGSLEPQPSDASAANMNNKHDPGFDRSEATPELEAEGLVENDSQISDPGTFRPSEFDARSVSLMEGVKFISNVYTLPHDDLMRKVIAQKTNRKSPSDEMTSKKTEAAAVEFDVKQLKSRQDKMRLQFVTDSSRFRQRLLERDPEDFIREDDH